MNKTLRHMFSDFWPRLKVPATRTVTAAILCLAIYIAIGSCMFGGWWYGFFWGGEFANFGWIVLGWRLLVSYHSYAVATIIIAIFLLFSIVVLVPRPLFAIVDRFRKHIYVV